MQVAQHLEKMMIGSDEHRPTAAAKQPAVDFSSPIATLSGHSVQLSHATRDLARTMAYLKLPEGRCHGIKPLSW